MSITYKGIGHIAIRCKNYKDELDFYTNKLGLPIAFETKDKNGELNAAYIQVTDTQYIILYPKTALHPHTEYTSNNKKCNRSHFHACFEIADRHLAIEVLENRGLPVGRTPDDSVGLCKSFCQFVVDPEENEWELMEFTKDSLQITQGRR